MGNHRQVQLKVVNHAEESTSIASVRWIRSGPTGAGQVPSQAIGHNSGQAIGQGINQGTGHPGLGFGLSGAMHQSEELGQHLTQVVLGCETSQDGLLELCKIVGNAFQADFCLIAQQSKVQSHSQMTWWGTEELAAPQLLHGLQDELVQVLNAPIVVSQWQFSEVLAIADLDLLDLDLLNFPVEKSAKRKKKSAKSPAKSPAKTAAKTAQKSAAPFAEESPAEKPRLRSVLAIHTQLHGHVNGIIAVVRSQPWDWQEAEVMLLRSLSPRIAVALSQAQLEQQVQQQIQYQTLNNQLTAAIRNNWSLEDIFALAIEGVTTALHVKRGKFLLFKYAEPLLKGRSPETLPVAKVTVVSEYPKAGPGGGWAAVKEFPSSDSWTDTSCLNRSFWTSDCWLCRQLMTQKTEPILLPTSKQTAEAYLREMDQDQGDLSPLFDLTAMPSLLLLPIENQGTVLGCLVLQHHQPRLWSIEELSFVKLVAAQLSTAIIQIRTLQQVQAVVNERTAQLQRSLEVQAKLYEKTRQQVDQLRRLNEEREVFLSTVSHELLTPLTSMRMAIQMLKQEELTPDRTTRYLNILEQQCNQETNLINDMLALRKLESTAAVAQLHKIDLKYLIRDIALTAAESWAEKGLGLEIDLPAKPLSIYTDPASLNRIFVELLSNAKKYADANSEVLLHVSHQVNSLNREIVLVFKNMGYGIQPDELPFIFDKFRRGKVAAKQAIQGTGLGLALVKGLVEHLNGSIDVTSEPLPHCESWETCFTITLPQSIDGMVQLAN